MSSPHPEPTSSTPAPAASSEAAAGANPTASTAPTAPTAPAATGAHWGAIGMPAEEDDGDHADADSAIGSDAASSTASISDSILEYRTINGRTYHSDRKAGDNLYWGPNDEQQNEGMDIFHHALTLLLDGKLHMAPLEEKNLKKAVDIGTGTGIWAIDFADLYNECQVIGTDLSPIQPGWVPPNCQFQIDDATQAWTFEEESLDYVHIRWLVGSIADWKSLLEQAYKCLKPGGWVEWFEFDGHFESDDGTVTDSSAMAQWSHIFEGGSRALGSTASFRNVRDNVAAKVMPEVGFINYDDYNSKVVLSPWAKDRKFKEIGRYVQAAMETDLEGYIGYMTHLLGWKTEEVAVYAAHLRREIRGCKLHGYYRCKNAWAQKPPKA